MGETSLTQSPIIKCFADDENKCRLFDCFAELDEDIETELGNIINVASIFLLETEKLSAEMGREKKS